MPQELTLKEKEQALRKFIEKQEIAKVSQNTIRIERSSTLAINSNFEKATFDLQLSIPLESLVDKNSIDTFVSAAENLVEEHVEAFKKDKLGETKPKTAPQPSKSETSAEPQIPTDGWRLWDSKKGESMGQGSAPRLFDLLEEDGHDEKHPLKHSDGFNYWIYPDSDYIQRARRTH